MSRRCTVKDVENENPLLQLFGRLYKQYPRPEFSAERNFLKGIAVRPKTEYFKGLAACERKNAYSKASAERAIFHALTERGIELRKYICEHCGEYHLTGQNLAFD